MSFDQTRWWMRNSAPPVWPIVFSMKLDRLENMPGSCTTNRRHSDVAPNDIDWVATISARSFFGVPVRRYRVTCGGTAIL
ncbi:hypothetical protein [Sphingomonas sp. Ant20]|jgi:hypothetical protein|uniref:hypothetical protein n=1 Tax=Sphingomonas sp. Ant20 TaxID=104605 RepID=UPI0018E2F67C|nr:hypothetical protein [Sphingomonas sp. Ant20]